MKDAYVDDKYLGRTASNLDPAVTNRTFPLPRPRRTVIDFLAPQSPETPVPHEPTGEPRPTRGVRRGDSLRGGDVHVRFWDGSRGQGFDHTLAARRVLPNEDFLD